MQWATRSVTLSLGAALLTGCVSENNFRPWTGDEEPSEDTADGDGDGTGGTGGWGDWEPSSIPDIAIVLGTQDAETHAGEIVIADLRGRVLDRWTPPVDDVIGTPNRVLQVQPVAPGEVLVSLSADGFWYSGNKTQNGGFNELPGDRDLPLRAWIGTSSVWHGDLVNRRWTRMMHIDWDTGQHVIDATGQVLPQSIWQSPWGVHVAPWPGSDHHLMITWHADACLPAAAQRVMVVSTDGTDRDQERFWRLDRDWDLEFEPVLMNLQASLRNDGEIVLLTQATDEGCYETGLEAPQLMRWRIDGGPQALADTEWGEAMPLLHGPSGAALRLQIPTEAHDWIMRWEGASNAVGASFSHDGAARMVAPLDPEHGAALLALTDPATGYDELVLVADGRDVWRIEELKQGLGRVPIQVTTGTVVSVP